MFDICILEKHLEDALENKNCEKFNLKKNPNKTKHAHNHNFKNKTKRIRRIWIEKGTYQGPKQVVGDLNELFPYFSDDF